MPTPSPIIAPKIKVKSGAGTTCPTSFISARPPRIARRAVTIGKPIATSDPKAMNKITAAARMPTLSAGPCGGVSAFSAMYPPSPSVTLSSEASLTMSTKGLTSVLVTSLSLSGMVVRAIRRSSVTRSPS